MADLPWLIHHGDLIWKGTLASLCAGGWLLPRALVRARALRLASLRQSSLASPSGDAPPRQGGPAVLFGVLRAKGSLARRLDDGAGAAATSASSLPWGNSQGRQGSSQRATDLWVDVGGQRVPLLGPVEVGVGSREVWPAVLLGWLPQAVRDRVRRLVGPAGGQLPGFAPVFRSLTDGDEVHVEGAWALREAGSRTSGYREAGGGFCVVPPSEGDSLGASPVIRITCLSAPSVLGPHPLVRLSGSLLGLAIFLVLWVLLAASTPQPTTHAATCAAGEATPAELASLLTPSGGLSREALRQRLRHADHLTPDQRSLLFSLERASGSCADLARSLLRFGRRAEAADEGSRCAEPAARWTAALALYELGDWARASDVVASTPLDGAPFAWPAGLGLRVHLLASRPARAAALARAEASAREADAQVAPGTASSRQHSPPPAELPRGQLGPLELRCIADAIEVRYPADPRDLPSQEGDPRHEHDRDAARERLGSAARAGRSPACWLMLAEGQHGEAQVASVLAASRAPTGHAFLDHLGAALLAENGIDTWARVIKPRPLRARAPWLLVATPTEAAFDLAPNLDRRAAEAMWLHEVRSADARLARSRFSRRVALFEALRGNIEPDHGGSQFDGARYWAKRALDDLDALAQSEQAGSMALEEDRDEVLALLDALGLLDGSHSLSTTRLGRDPSLGRLFRLLNGNPSLYGDNAPDLSDTFAGAFPALSSGDGYGTARYLRCHPLDEAVGLLSFAPRLRNGQREVFDAFTSAAQPTVVHPLVWMLADASFRSRLARSLDRSGEGSGADGAIRDYASAVHTRARLLHHATRDPSGALLLALIDRHSPPPAVLP